jgi:hypothetical protein
MKAEEENLNGYFSTRILLQRMLKSTTKTDTFDGRLN